MKKFYLFVLAFCCLSAVASAQKVSGIIKGYLQDSVSAAPLSDATISVMSLPDSSLISFTLTSSNGYFEIKNLNAGDYIVVSSYVGLRSFKKKFTISAAKQTEDLGAIQLQRADKYLDEVIITEAPVKINGDTISFRADAFKTKPNATVEDLLKKLPGVQVERDGTVKAQGENVQKVYVDGKEFFSNDPKLATKNLTADMVDRVDVYDDMSEQAKFNGIDDGSRSKAINLKLKKDKKKGIFGNVKGGYGSDQRYDAGLTANYFKGATQANVIAKSNNTNNVGYTISDMLGMFSGGGGNMGSMMGGGNMGGGGGTVVMGGMGGMGGSRGGGVGNINMGGFNLGSGGTGITSSSQAGLNYRDTWSKYFDVNGSYFFNHTQRENVANSLRQNFLTDSTITTSEETFSKNRNSNHRANLNMIYSVDSFNSVIFQPNISFQNSQSYSNNTLISTGATKILNQGFTVNDNLGNGYNWSNNLLWRRKFRKAGRTLSVNLSNNLNSNDRKGVTVNELTVRKSDQMNNTESSTNNYGLTISYTEPIARDKILEFNYSRNDNHSRSDRRTFNKNIATGNYDQVIAAQTNLFENSNLYDRFGTNLRIVKKKYNYQLGFSVQQTTLESNNLSKNSIITQKATNLFPTASFNYNFQRSRSLRINYRGRTNQPTASQLQDVENLDNYPYISRGNPSLKQEFSHNVMISYNFFDILKLRNLFAFLTYNATQNKIGNAIEYRPGGVQFTQPINLNGVYNVSANVNMGFPIKNMQGGNFNFNTRIGYNQDANIVNRQENYSRTLSVGEEVRLNYNYKEKLDMGISAGINYNQVKNTVQQESNNAYFTHLYTADITYTLPKDFILSTDVDYTFNTGLASGYNQNYAIWNAGLAKQIFKNKRGEIKASVYDILNQNTSISRTVDLNYIQDVRNTTLKRFFMLTFTYRINRMGGRTMPSIVERATRGIRGN